jgi:hypothetical protein
MKSLLALFMGVSAALPALAAPRAENPNILLIVADDMGFSDLGYHRSNYHHS